MERDTLTETMSGTGSLNEVAELWLDKCKVVLRKKGQDYTGGQKVSPYDYFKFEEDCPNLKVLHTKVLRYASITSQDNVNYESVEDTLMDIINYAAIALAALNKGQPT